jgi:HlyD family secretion protein
MPLVTESFPNGQPHADRDLVERLGLNSVAKLKISRNQWIALAVAAIVVLVAFRAFLWSTPIPTYLTQPVTRGDLTISVSATGTLAPRNQVDVGAEVSGRIDSVSVDFNDRVRKGEELARINTQNFEAQLAQARATLAQAEATLLQAAQTRGRMVALMKSNAASRQQLDAANADLARAEAGVRLARAQVSANETTLTKATIYSPIDGVVLDRKISAGQTVVAAMTTPLLFTLASDLSQMELDVDIDEADVGQLRTGARAYFTVDAYPSRTFPAKLISIHNAPKTVQGVVTYQGVLLVENREGLLRPGMTATADISASEIHNVKLVSNGALRFVPPDDVKANAPPLPAPQAGITWGRVWVNDGSKLAPHDVRTGATDGRSTVVLSGDLQLGDNAVTDIQGHQWQTKPQSSFAP